MTLTLSNNVKTALLVCIVILLFLITYYFYKISDNMDVNKLYNELKITKPPIENFTDTPIPPAPTPTISITTPPPSITTTPPPSITTTPPPAITTTPPPAITTTPPPSITTTPPPAISITTTPPPAISITTTPPPSITTTPPPAVFLMNENETPTPIPSLQPLSNYTFNIQSLLAGENTTMPPNMPNSISMSGIPSMNVIEQNDYQGVGNIYLPYVYTN